MKRLISIASMTFALVGCADTPQNRELWQGIASGMNSASDSMNQTTNKRLEMMKQSQQQINSQPARTTNCTTSYNSLFKQYETTCR
jgi:chlorite dismutase